MTSIFPGYYGCMCSEGNGGVCIMSPGVVPEKSNIIYDLSQTFLVGVEVNLV